MHECATELKRNVMAAYGMPDHVRTALCAWVDSVEARLASDEEMFDRLTEVGRSRAMAEIGDAELSGKEQAGTGSDLESQDANHDPPAPEPAPPPAPAPAPETPPAPDPVPAPEPVLDTPPAPASEPVPVSAAPPAA